ncbi:hypothetical protein PVAND_000706 [Polypedilum vanderplanki]|uniref:C2H2-type domain-containing protein n=1 Tax=Polypedilum vanderplanki TaxID=319348 RepID=A0A9J6BL01_POLVA|nr:hypothetical protein PVAND_000706 [Polypedilum vanderplanki]
MFWILRRTEAFINSFNNNTSKSIERKESEKTAWLRFRYGRLSMDSDDQTACKKFDNENDDDNTLVEFNVRILDKINAQENQHHNNNINKNKNQYVDNNGNSVVEGKTNRTDECNCVEFSANMAKKCDRNASPTNVDNFIDDKLIRKLQSVSLSDDDYDENLTCNVCDRAFKCQRQLASHQQKKRHFGCNACDTLYPSLMLLEHHKEEYEHWSDNEEFQNPCCRHNRRNDFEYSDSESCTSDAESEDLERLL